MERTHVTRDRDEDSSNSTRTDNRDSGGANERVDAVASLHRQVGNQAVQRLVAEGHVQPHLSVSTPNDPAEREADQVARQVAEMPDPERVTDDDEDERNQGVEPVGGTPTGRSVTVTREATASTSVDGSTDLENRLASIKGGGRPLPEGVRSEFERKMGHDFGDVRVHTGSEADGVARSIDARAFTHGSDVVFKRGEYAPNTPSGNQLLAHELTHVVQQGAAPRTDRVQRQEDASQGDSESSSSSETSGGSAGGESGIPKIYREAIAAAVKNMPEAERQAILDEVVPEEKNVTVEKSSEIIANNLRDQLLEEMAEKVAGATFGAAMGAALGFVSIISGTITALQAFANAQNPYEDIGGAMGGAYGVMCAIKRPETPEYPDPPSDITETARNAFIKNMAEQKAETLGEMYGSSPEELVAYYRIYQAGSGKTEEILNEMWSGFLGSVQYSNAKNLAPETIEWPQPQSGLYDPGEWEQPEESSDVPLLF